MNDTGSKQTLSDWRTDVRFEKLEAEVRGAHARIGQANRRARIHSILTILFLATALAHAAHDFGWL